MRFSLATLLTAVVLVSLGATLAVPTFARQRRERQERLASAALQSLTKAQADFRSNDRDGNLVNDFWTADVYALYALIPMAGDPPTSVDGGDAGRAIRLLEASIAHADGCTRTSMYGNLRPERTGASRDGYLYRAFGWQDDGAGPTTLLNDTDGDALYGAVHDRSRFAFIAFPVSHGDGDKLLIVNADDTIYRISIKDRAGYAVDYRPLRRGEDSSSRLRGTGVQSRDADLELDGPGTGVYPSPPRVWSN